MKLQNWRRYRATWSTEQMSHLDLIKLLVTHTISATIFLYAVIYVWSIWGLLVFGTGLWISASAVSHACEELLWERLPEERPKDPS